ncbi:nucleotide pyrophosphohydrolase [Archaeoglobales archaeon]|nr:MAG: nucleotide pyrophosphohydrolase [Archaeoglobales archaeon]
MQELTKEIIRFRDARDWKKYHTPKNLAISIAVELGELFELFQWKSDEEIISLIDDLKPKLEEEVADVAIYLFLLAHELNINLEEAISDKIKKNEEKYPIELSKGEYRKYTNLDK